MDTTCRCPKPAARPSRHRQRRILLLVAALAAAVVFSVLIGSLWPLTIPAALLVMAFSAMWPWFFVTSRWYRPRTRGSGNAGRISVIVPARNEEAVVGRMVASIRRQTYPDWELVVAVNHSDDETYIRAVRAAEGDQRVVVLECESLEGGKGPALNEALARCTGEVVVQFDTDCLVPPDFLERMSRYFKDEHVAAAQAVIRAANGKENLLTRLQDMEFIVYSRVFNRGRDAAGLSSSLGGTGVAIRRSALESVGGWRNDLVEDFELFMRLADAGARVVHAGDAVVYDEKPASWDALVRQRSRWIRGHFGVLSRHGWRCRTVWDTLYLLTPLMLVLQLGLLLLGYASAAFLHRYLAYAYISPVWWLASLVVMAVVTTAVMREEEERGYMLLTPAYLLVYPFHWVLVLLAALPRRSWDQTKTVHFGDSPDRRSFAPLRFLGVTSVRSSLAAASLAAIACLWLYPLTTFALTPHPEGLVISTRPEIAVASASIAGSPVRPSSESTGYVSGRVVSGDSVIAGADVTLRKLGRDHETCGTQTNDDGAFAICDVEPGIWVVRVKAKGSVASRRFTMGPGQWVRLDADLAERGRGAVVPVILPY